MQTRTIVGTLRDGAGNLYAGTPLTFTPVDVANKPVDFFDIEGDWISSTPIQVQTDLNGEFSVTLATTSNATSTVYWRCSVGAFFNNAKVFKDFLAPLDYGDGTDLDFIDFRAAGAVLTATGETIFSAHTADSVIHITAAERALWNAGGEASGVVTEYVSGTETPTGRYFRVVKFDDGQMGWEEIV